MMWKNMMQSDRPQNMHIVCWMLKAMNMSDLFC